MSMFDIFKVCSHHSFSRVLRRASQIVLFLPLRAAVSDGLQFGRYDRLLAEHDLSVVTTSHVYVGLALRPAGDDGCILFTSVLSGRQASEDRELPFPMRSEVLVYRILPQFCSIVLSGCCHLSCLLSSEQGV